MSTEHQETPCTQNPSWIDALPELDAALRSEGFSDTPDRWLNVSDLMVQMRTQGALPDDEQSLRLYLSPLFCRSALDQASFEQLFKVWWDTHQRRAAQADRPKPVSVAPPVKQSSKKTAHQVVRVWPFALACLLSIAVIAVLVFVLQDKQSISVEPEKPEIATSINAGTASGSEEILPIKPLLPRQPPEQVELIPDVPLPEGPVIALSGIWQVLWLLLPWLPLILLFWILLYTRTRRKLNRQAGDPNSPLEYLALRHRQDNLFDGPGVRAGLKRLHTPVAQESLQLDIDQSVEATVRQAGFFSPVFKRRMQVPELMLWIDCRGLQDPILALTDALVQRLKACDLWVSVYRYQGEPDRLQALETQQWYTHEQVLELHPGSRVLLTSQAGRFVDLWSNELVPWLLTLAQRFDTAILDTTAAPAEQIRQFENAHIVRMPFNSAGIAQVCAKITAAPQVESKFSAFPLPTLLQSAEKWCSPVAPAQSDQQNLLSVLKAYLGAEGYRLFCAAALYPELRWVLVRALDVQLALSSAFQQREARMLKLAQLPWTQVGCLPVWLRRLILKQLSKQQLSDIRAAYTPLLAIGIEDDKQWQQEALPIRFEVTSRYWTLRVRRLFLWAEKESLLEDSVFVKLMLGPWSKRLDFELPRIVDKVLPVNERWRRVLNSVMAMVLVGVLGLGLQQLQRTYLTPWLVDTFNVGGLSQQVSVRLVYNVRTAALAESVIAAVGDRIRVNVLLEKIPLVWSEDEEVAVLVYEPKWFEAAQWLADRVAFAGYGLRPKLLSTEQVRVQSIELSGLGEPGNVLQLWLNLPNQIGSVFADALDKSFSREVWQKRLEGVNTEVVIASVEKEVEQKKPEPLYALTIEPTPADARVRVMNIRQVYQPRMKLPTGNYRIRLNHADYQEQDFQITLDSSTPSAPIALMMSKPVKKLIDKNVENWLPGTVFQDELKSGGKGPLMVVIPEGNFLMGSPEDEEDRLSSEGPQREVSIIRFAAGQTEVTFEDYDRFVKATGRDLPNDRGWGRKSRPVIDINWEEAKAYTVWLSEQTGHAYRLLSEAEWEYVARAGTTTPFNIGACISNQQANFNDRTEYRYAKCPASGQLLGKTQPVRSYQENPYGLFDVHGNVWEWVEDCWHVNYEGAPLDQSAWLGQNEGNCSLRVVRGGSWGDGPLGLRSALRDRLTTVDGNFVVGFRLARTL